jgi:hypothetical protein
MLFVTGNRAGAVTEWRRALELDPHIPGLRERMERIAAEIPAPATP